MRSTDAELLSCYPILQIFICFLQILLEAQFEIDNKQQTAQCDMLLSASHLGAADSLANSNEAVAILYDQFSPGRIILPQFLEFSR